MGLEQAQRWCEHCEKDTLHARTNLDFGWGCLLTLLTGGLFLLYWLPVGFFESLKPFRCQFCGSQKRNLVSLVVGPLLVGLVVIVGLGMLVTPSPRPPAESPPDVPAPAIAVKAEPAPVLPPVPSAPQAPAATAERSVPAIGVGKAVGPALLPGTEVELIGPDQGPISLAASEEIFRESQAHAREFILGDEVFGVGPSVPGRLLEVHGDVVCVKVLAANWKGRTGWIARDQVRIPPNATERAADVSREGFDLGVRRAIYADLHRVGMVASNCADRDFPFAEAQIGDKRFTAHLASHKATCDRLEAEGRRFLNRKYRTDGKTLDAIDKEGMEKRWPVPDVPSSAMRLHDVVDMKLPLASPAQQEGPNPSTDRAESSAREASESASRRASVALNIGQNLEKSGKTTAALKAYRAIVKDFAGKPQAVAAAVRLKAMAE